MAKIAINPEGVHAPTMYSHVIKCGNTLYLAGQTPRDLEGKPMGIGDIEAQAVQVFEKLKIVLAAAGATLDDVVKETVYITDLSYRDKVGEVRRRYHKQPYPASTLVVVKSLSSPELMIEVDAIAVLD